MGKHYDFKGLAAELLGRAHSLMPQWLPGGRLEGREWVATNPTRGDSKPGSFKVNVNTGKWSDFAIGDATGGDLIALYCYLRGLEPAAAYAELTGSNGIELEYTKNKDNKKPASFQELVEPLPVPEDAPEMPTPKGRPGAALYLDPDNGDQLYPITIYRDYKNMPVYRVVTTRSAKTGNKFPVPTAWSRWVREDEKWDVATKTFVKTGKVLDTIGWNPRDWQKEIPLCGADWLIRRPEAPVLVVEGEKTWASAIARLPEYAAVTWRGGVNRVKATNWKELRDRKVIICPDYDAQGQKAALEIAAILKRQGNDVKICWEPLGTGLHEPGWDIADEQDVDRVRDYIKLTSVFLSNVEALLNAAPADDEESEVMLDNYNSLLSTISGEMLDNQNQLRCLGYGGDNKCYFISRQRGIVLALSANQLASLDFLLALMPLKF